MLKFSEIFEFSKEKFRKIPILKECEWFEWFEWFGPSPIEPFNSGSSGSATSALASTARRRSAPARIRQVGVCIALSTPRATSTRAILPPPTKPAQGWLGSMSFTGTSRVRRLTRLRAVMITCGTSAAACARLA